MNRRMLLKAGGLALCSLAFTRRRLSLAPVLVSWDRVLRTTVGLRPHRPSGFVLRPETIGEKLLVHNYGHGGAGMSLAWGTGAIAADFALAQEARRAAVIGCGSAGLTAARQLQRRGFEVTIYAATVPPDTTSNMSLASFTPTSGLIARERRTPAWDAQFTQAANISYRQLQLLEGAHYGVSWIDSYQATDDATTVEDREEDGLLPEPLRASRQRNVLGPGDHPFPTRYLVCTSSLRIEPSIYLEALVRDFMLFGGRIVVRCFDSPEELGALPEPVIVNCTGLGSYTLFKDEELVPIKGQLTLLAPQDEVTYRAGRGGGVAMTPRRDGIVLGNTQERGDWSLDVNEDLLQLVMADAITFFGAVARHLQ